MGSSLPSQPILTKSVAIPDMLRLVILSAGLTLLFIVLQLHYDFSLWDEGFLWYGVQQVMQGAVPVRDFMSYDPGRYYVAAGLMSLWGSSSLLSLRWAMAILQVCTVTGVLLIIRAFSDPLDPATGLCPSNGLEGRLNRTKKCPDASVRPRSPAFWLGATLTLLGWNVPIFQGSRPPGLCASAGGTKLFGAKSEQGRSSRSRVLRRSRRSVRTQPWRVRRRGQFRCGSLVDIRPGKKTSAWPGARPYGVIGITLGLSPVLLMMAMVPGFAAAMAETVRQMFEYWRHQHPKARTLAMAHQPCSLTI